MGDRVTKRHAEVGVRELPDAFRIVVQSTVGALDV